MDEAPKRWWIPALGCIPLTGLAPMVLFVRGDGDWRTFLALILLVLDWLAWVVAAGVSGAPHGQWSMAWRSILVGTFGLAMRAALVVFVVILQLANGLSGN